MPQLELIHIVPFDLGLSVTDYDKPKKFPREKFFKELNTNLTCKIETSDKFLCKFNASKNITCYIFDYGVGVFTVRNLTSQGSINLSREALDSKSQNNTSPKSANELTTRFSSIFKDKFACQAYYKRTLEQNSIFASESTEANVLFDIIAILWKIRCHYKDYCVRSFSSCEGYKQRGLSYILTIYHVVSDEVSASFDKQLDLMMNPALMRNILNENKWSSISDAVDKYEKAGYKCVEYSDSSKVLSSWSSVAVVEKKNSNLIKRIIAYEIMLQGCWFLLDVMIDNLENENFSSMDLQKCRAIVSEIYLSVDTKISANMSTSDRLSTDIIYETSGIELVKRKAFMLLDSRISIEQTKRENRQTLSGIITEILLIAFTLFQIHTPVKNILTGNLTSADVFTMITLVLVLILCSVLIVKKEK